jgi:hypothetical protein
LYFSSIANCQNIFRGKHITTVFLDNIWRNEKKDVDVQTQLRTPIYCDNVIQIQSGLTTTKELYLENRNNIYYIKYIDSDNYSIALENSLINKLGYTRYALEYLLER